MHIEVKSSRFESKVLNGELAKKGGHRYMASLQLNEKHICSSGIFQTGFLLTTGHCAFNMGQGIETSQKKGTAVLADLNLKNGQRIDIFKVAYFSSYELYDFEIGVIMVDRFNIANFVLKAIRNRYWY